MSVRILGFGSVGRRTAQILAKHGVRVSVVSDSKGAYALKSNDELETLIENKKSGNEPSKLVKDTKMTLLEPSSEPVVIADCSGSDVSAAVLVEALKSKNFGVAMANKKPMTDSPEVFKSISLNPNAKWEATVGAGLPVIVTAKRLMDGGDTIQIMQGQLSGTLGYILSRLDDPKLGTFSDAVKEAERLGYTEPDPRDDLSGVDVGRKALILARYGLGMSNLKMEDVVIEPLYPKEFASLSLDQFRARLPELDKEWATKIEAARKKGKVLRYAASVSRASANPRVGLVEVDIASPLGGLKGTLNLVTFQTDFYTEGRNLVVSGPGAGVDVTASGVAADVVDLLNRMRR